MERYAYSGDSLGQFSYGWTILWRAATLLLGVERSWNSVTMSEFNPAPRDRFVIGGTVYQVMPHPAVPSFAFGQEGRKAFVYQIGDPEGHLYALKKFKMAFRIPELVEICDALARFAQWPGLEVCARQCLHRDVHDDAIDEYPDLEFSVLMPWIGGSTWYDIIIGETPLSRLEALTFANATAQVLSALEESGLAHCDIAAPNVIINPATGRAHLIDVEDIYAPGFSPPAALPAGTDGYAHQTASRGLWESTADRFAGAILMSEMSAWFSPQIRRDADEEHYFGVGEMQQDSPRYRLMRDTLEELEPRLAELFEQAWHSDTLGACPQLREWYAVINDVYHSERLSKVVSDWRPIGVPGVAVDPASRSPASDRQPIQAPSVPVSTAGPAAGEPKPAPSRNAAPLQETAEKLPSASSISPAPGVQRAPPSAPIQPAATSGPVIEWRPIRMPQAATSEGSEVRSIDPGARESADAEQAFTPIVMPESELDTDAEWEAQTVLEEPSPADTQNDIEVNEGVEDAVPVEEHGPGKATRVNGDVSKRTTGDSLLRPILDLSHVDKRNRPFLVWSESPGATHYLIQEAQSPDFESPKAFKVKAKNTLWHPTWGRSGKFFYRVRALGQGTKSAWSEVLSLRIGE